MSDELVRVEPKNLDTINVVSDMVLIGQRTDTNAIGKFTLGAFQTGLGLSSINASINDIENKLDDQDSNLIITSGGVQFGESGPMIRFGTGSPEGVVTAGVGSIYLRTNGGANTSFYIKESGTSNTGWAAK